jgi:shikimate O-hydroxycinnamoyltransferase
MRRTVKYELIRAGVRAAPQYLTGLDLRVGHPASPCLLVYPHGVDGDALKHSLALLLRAYPIVTGRMKADTRGMVYIDDSDTGMAFAEQRHARPMPLYGPDNPIGADIPHYFRQIYPWKVVGHPQALFVIEVHHFTCGGAILSIMGVHSLCDGGAFWSFMQDWLRLHRGHPTTPPALDRQGLIEVCEAHMGMPYTQGFVARLTAVERAGLMARMAWQHLTQMDTLTLRITPAQIAAWREQARHEGQDEDMPAAHEFVVAHCMKNLSARLPASYTRYIGQVADLRYRRIPGIARKYMGNAVGHDLVALTQEGLADSSLARIARRCRMPVDRNSESDILSYLGLMGRHRLTNSNQSLWVTGIVHCLEGGIMLNNCAHFPVYKMDFGRGPPSWFDFGRTPYRMLVLTPSPQMNGGFIVRLTARKHELAGFKPLSV